MDLGVAIDVVWKVGTLLGFGWMYLANRDKVTNTRISKLEVDLDVKLDEHSDRLTTLEGEVKNSPTHKDVGQLYERMIGLEHRLSDRVDGVSGAVKELQGASVAQTRILNLVYESLIKKG